MREHEIRATGFEFNMAGWVHEKSGNVLGNLARLLDGIRSSGLTEEAQAPLLGQIRQALWDATKLQTFSTGAEWSTDDADFILEGGHKAFCELEARYFRSACFQYEGRPLRLVRSEP